MERHEEWDAAAAAARHGRPHAALPERRADSCLALHETFVREARQAGVEGRPRCNVLFVGDSLTEAMRGTQFGESYDELGARRAVFNKFFPRGDALAFGITGDRTQHILWRLTHGELEFRHPPRVVVVGCGTNNVGRDGDGPGDAFLGIRAVVLEVLSRLPGTRVLLPGILPRGPAPGFTAQTPPAAGESAAYSNEGGAGSRDKYVQPGQHTDVINQVNARLKVLAANSGGTVVYCDCQAPFLEPGGKRLKPELMRDALHPTSLGMEAWFKVLVPAIRALADGGIVPRAGAGSIGVDSANDDVLSENHGSLVGVDPAIRPVLVRLIRWSPHPLCVCDVREKEHPIVYVNDNFVIQTGFTAAEVIGKNCRFLQGPGTDTATVKRLGDAIRTGGTATVEVMNFHKSGDALLNKLTLSPLRDASGAVTHYIGVQQFIRQPPGFDATTPAAAPRSPHARM